MDSPTIVAQGNCGKLIIVAGFVKGEKEDEEIDQNEISTIGLNRQDNYNVGFSQEALNLGRNLTESIYSMFVRIRRRGFVDGCLGGHPYMIFSENLFTGFYFFY